MANEQKKVVKVTRNQSNDSPSKKENTGVLGVMNSYKGQFISLNMKVAPFFGIGTLEDGSNKIWLSANNWFDQVPDNLTEEEVDMLTRAIRDKKVILGKRWIPAIDKDKEVKNKYIKHVKSFKFCTEEFKDIVRGLVRRKKEGNYTAIELLRAMIETERAANNRPDFVKYLEDAIDHCSGPVSLVEDYPTDPENFTVTIDPLTKQVVESTKKIKEPTMSDDPVTRSAKIEDALN